MLELRKKLEEVLGDGLPVKIAIDLWDRSIATIEELRFIPVDYCKKSQRKLMLLDACSRCEAETGVTIDSLADLGQLYEGLGIKVSLGYTGCIALTDDDLKL